METAAATTYDPQYDFETEATVISNPWKALSAMEFQEEVNRIIQNDIKKARNGDFGAEIQASRIIIDQLFSGKKVEMTREILTALETYLTQDSEPLDFDAFMIAINDELRTQIIELGLVNDVKSPKFITKDECLANVATLKKALIENKAEQATPTEVQTPYLTLVPNDKPSSRQPSKLKTALSGFMDRIAAFVSNASPYELTSIAATQRRDQAGMAA